MKILLVIDIQEKYLNYYDADLLPRINAKIAAAKSTGTQVFYVRNIGINGDDDSYALAKYLLIVSDNIYEKKFPSAFTNDSFVKELQIQNVTELEIIGVDGNSCIKKTYLDAANAGYKVTLNLHCTAARNEKIFEKTLNELRNAGVIITV
ncbi:cysteine hydrolase family protein [Butyrivibrio sp. AE2015]|uniref:cysteine hydrolase family protein n=1 Tax=Butyrivibrio sp. AE2015 TaxID=1280663 RepID=UPI0009DB94BA|nr:isochorismatase family cysteine hydrolase [Butyrivibrio sp. AE2015]